MPRVGLEILESSVKNSEVSWANSPNSSSTRSVSNDFSQSRVLGRPHASCAYPTHFRSVLASSSAEDQPLEAFTHLRASEYGSCRLSQAPPVEL